MSETITLTISKEDYEALQSGASITIRPPKLDKWEPFYPPVDDDFYTVTDFGEVEKFKFTSYGMDNIRNFGNVSFDRASAEEIAKRNRTTNRISQYVFEHLQNGEERNYWVFYRNGEWQHMLVSNEVFHPGVVLMPNRIAKMLCDDLNSGKVEL